MGVLHRLVLIKNDAKHKEMSSVQDADRGVNLWLYWGSTVIRAACAFKKDFKDEMIQTQKNKVPLLHKSIYASDIFIFGLTDIPFRWIRIMTMSDSKIHSLQEKRATYIQQIFSGVSV